jgi:protoporphyrinogen oxidase
MDYLLIKPSIQDGTNPTSLSTTASREVIGRASTKNESSLKDIVRDQLRTNAEFCKKFLANDKVLESIDSKMSTFTVAIQKQLNFNKMLETQIAQLASALAHPNKGSFPG